MTIFSPMIFDKMSFPVMANHIPTLVNFTSLLTEG
jgi:hypothetical protein